MPRILLIEDEPGIAESVVYALETEGMQVRWCAACGPGLAAFGGETFDLVLLDVGLPDGNGFELFARLRALRDVPTLFLTARGEEIDRVVGLELGADDYVVKPFSPRELAARVRAVLRRSREVPAAAPVPAAGALVVDPERREIRFHGRTLELTAYQYRILSALIARPGRVLSRSELLGEAAGEPDVALERTVDSHIKAIRARLRAIEPTTDPIRTHRGHGYSLAD